MFPSRGQQHGSGWVLASDPAFRLLSLKDPTIMDKAGPLQPPFCWLAPPTVHRVVCESFEFCCLLGVMEVAMMPMKVMVALVVMLMVIF